MGTVSPGPGSTTAAPRRPIVIRDEAHRRELQQYIVDHTRVDANGCWIWTGGTNGPSGRGRFYVSRRSVYAYRVSYTLWNGEIPAGLCVCHKCDVPACVAPHHLFAGSVRDNVQDAWVKGRLPLPRLRYGMEHPAAQHTDEQVAEVVRRHLAGETQAALAREFGTTQQTISGWVHRVARATTATHVPPPPRRLVPCGTPTAFARHYARGERPCDDCRRATSEYYKAKRRARAEGGAA